MNQIWLNAVRTAGAFVLAGAYDAIPNLVHLYEPARRGLISYTGSLVRIRRSSDSLEQDFGYTGSGNLDTAAITTFLGGSNGFIVTVYDQVGTDNLTQATAARHPAYVASGQNGRPVMRFNGLSHLLKVTYTGALSQPYHYYALTALDTVSVNGGDKVFIDEVGTTVVRIQQWSSPTPDSWMVYAGAVLSDGDTTDDPSLLTVLWNGASSNVRINGASVASGNAGAANATGITIGAISDADFFWDGDVMMVAIADPSHDDTERGAMETAVDDYWSVIP